MVHNAKQMKRCVTVALCLLILSAAAAGQVSITARNSVPSPKLMLSVRTDRSTYSMKDKLHLEVQLTNVGDTDVYVWDWIFCWGQGPALSIHALNERGDWVQPVSGFLMDCVPPPPREGDLSQFIRIEPGRFYGMAQEFDLRDLVDGPGERTLVIGLSGVLGRDFIRKLGYSDLPYWTSAEKPVFAKVKITVTP